MATTSPAPDMKTDKSTMRPASRRQIADAPDSQSEVFTVHVGCDHTRKTFFVHKNLLVKHSDFFKAATTSSWREGQEGIISLNDDDPATFQIFCAFLYTGEIFIMQDGDRGKPAASSGGQRRDDADGKQGDEHAQTTARVGDGELLRLALVWCLAQKLLCTSLKDAATDALLARMTAENSCPMDMHIGIYPQSSSRSQMRKLLIDIGVTIFRDGAIKEGGFHARSAEYYFDLLVAREGNPSSRTSRADLLNRRFTCHYHEHVAEGKPCYKTMF